MAAIGEFVNWVGLPIHLKVKQNQKFTLDRGGDTGGRNVTIYTLNPGHKNMTFSVDEDGRIHMADAPDWVLDAGTKNAAGVNIKTIQLSKNQNIANHNRLKWKLHSDGLIESLAYPGKVLDVSRHANNTAITLNNTTGSNQKWVPALVDKLYDGSNIKGMYDSATKKSSLSLSEYARAWNAPFIMELSIEGYDSCLEIPYETFCCPTNKYDIISCILIIIIVVFALILIYLYTKRDNSTDDSEYTDIVYKDDQSE